MTKEVKVISNLEAGLFEFIGNAFSFLYILAFSFLIAFSAMLGMLGALFIFTKVLS